ncbi:hydroxysteroid 11-beta-dehydrogenase 1-like protein isoform X1 [Pimephales promelas]|uniref:11-beta-hydroxysteroid dehydrogenase-like protein n=2 Tax=Pimephales promelas TaxID=90988 RepID=Q0GJJ1_PIMPR|nr:hydroxysteroid 11-beta-dehydrogenase 1-like protein isoform X1 [Pimephales promelas]ABI20737.1 11-beta-hydroxysteroid dehydrogenase-like protein [Pimephales promelas]KAG1925109.1 corticosteroid 11-beta-dehydrogenase isozyme [Pimephales promelas]
MKVYVSLFVLIAALMSYMWRDTFDPDSVRGARVLITGASSGIGEQMAYHYAKFGAQIIITARRLEALKKVAQKCVKLGAQKMMYMTGDMSDPADPERVVKYAVEKLGGLDFLVLNHVGDTNVEFWNRDADHVRSLMQVNFVSYTQMTAAALPALETSAGSIIVVSSMAGKLASPFVAPYTSTKFAMNGFFGAMQSELAMQKSNVSVSIMILGLIDTESAMRKIRGFSTMTAYPASEAALSIIKAGASRQKEAYYPWFHYFTCLINNVFPFLKDLLLSGLSKDNKD